MSSSIVKLYGKRRPTKKQTERRKWVDTFTHLFDRPPTLGEIGAKFGISKVSAWETMQRLEKNTDCCPMCGRNYK